MDIQNFAVSLSDRAIGYLVRNIIILYPNCDTVYQTLLSELYIYL